jgi:hypothetical protein
VKAAHAGGIGIIGGCVDGIAVTGAHMMTASSP